MAQVRETAAYLTRFAKTNDIAIIMVGHVTKDGTLAGPKVLEHCIDCSVMLDGETDSRFRTLRSHKNRFGAVNELGVFAMTEQGLREVSNPSAIFLSRGDEVTSGSSVMVVWEGTRFITGGDPSVSRPLNVIKSSPCCGGFRAKPLSNIISRFASSWWFTDV